MADFEFSLFTDKHKLIFQMKSAQNSGKMQNTKLNKHFSSNETTTIHENSTAKHESQKKKKKFFYIYIMLMLHRDC